MGKIKDIITELNLTEEQQKDKDIQKFVLAVGYRKQTGDWYQYWNGNGYCELNKKNGTMITTVLTDEPFKAEFPLNMDVHTSDRCIMGCEFCYANCTKEGKHADIKGLIADTNSFIYSIHEGTELALNGNEPIHPDMELLLQFCKDRNIIANLTVNEVTLLTHTEQLENWLDNGLIHGIGISPKLFSDDMIKFCQKHPTAVLHTIAGVTTPDEFKTIMDKDLKVLVLGYKTFGRGIEYILNESETISDNTNWLQNNIQDFVKHFKVVSFDNLAVTQLNVKAWLSEEQWETFYRGDDGNHTLFVDLVNMSFAKNSMQPRSSHYAVLPTTEEMLKVIQNEQNAN